jgi:oligopeptide/dipeptide ABC transporter ATP-binding protein
MNSNLLLQVRDLCVAMPGPVGGTIVVEGVDLDLHRGEAFGLVGESGCGKTTTLLAILGLLPAGARVVSGRVTFDGVELIGASRRQLSAVWGAGIGVVWQDPLAALDPVMRVGPQVAEVVRAHTRANAAGASARAKELLRQVELPDVERLYAKYPHELSGGQRQRVVIAAAIAGRPSLLLADEPTTALDVTVQDQILALLAGLRDELGLTLMLVTHNLGIVDQSCDSVAVMYAGRVVETGTVNQVFAAPRHPYTAGLLAAAPAVDRPGVRPAGIAGSPPAAVARGACAFAARCGRVEPSCRAQLPALSGGSGHLTACLYPLDSVSMPDGAAASSHG